jgi:hypothetical protein
MADVEIVFPSKKVGVRPFQLVNLAVTLVTAFVMGAFTLIKVGARPRWPWGRAGCTFPEGVGPARCPLDGGLLRGWAGPRGPVGRTRG